MSHAELLSARITDDAWRIMRMLTFSIIYVGVLLSPVAVLCAFYWGWKVVENVILH